MTHQAVIGSLLRYAMIPVGSLIPEDLLLKIETHILNVVARKVTGLYRSARPESLHLLADTQSYKNQYILHCAEFLDGSLRVSNSTIASRLRRELQNIFEVTTLESVICTLTLPLRGIFLYDFMQTSTAVWENATMTFSQHTEVPNIKRERQMNRIFTCQAEEIRGDVAQLDLMFNFEQTFSWIDIALQVLLKAGWRPECAGPQTLNLERSRPARSIRSHVRFNSVGSSTYST